VVLDTNALLMQFQFNIDLVGELQRLLGAVNVHVPDVCLTELQHLKDRNAPAAVELAKRFNIERTSGGRGDDAVLSTSEERTIWPWNDFRYQTIIILYRY
jgi:rRNA-processing protein FCF1